MMQHLATQKAEAATKLLVGRQQQESVNSERGQDFAELMERNRVAEAQRDQREQRDQQEQRSESLARSQSRNESSNKQASHQQALNNERRDASQANSRTAMQDKNAAERASEYAAEKQSSDRTDTHHAEANQAAEDDGQQASENDSASEVDAASGEENAGAGSDNEQFAESSETDAEAVADANANAENGSNNADVIDEALLSGTTGDESSVDTVSAGDADDAVPAEEFDWLSMLDKLHGKQDTAGDKAAKLDENGELVKADEVIESDDNEEVEIDTGDVAQVNAADILKTFSETKSEQVETGTETESVKANTEVETDNDPDGNSEQTEEQSLADILSMLDQLREQDNVSDEDLVAFDKMIDDFMARHPELADSPLQQYSGKDWLNLDSKLLRGVVQAATGVTTETANIDKQVASADAGLMDNLLKADTQQVQKVAEHLAQNVIPKEINTPENRTTFADNLKAGLEELKAQLQSGRDGNADISQVVKDALASIDGVTQTDINGARLQQTLATTSATMEVASHLSDPKSGVADTIKAQGAAAAKEGAVTQSELTRQQTSQMDRLVNIHKPDAPQQMADKVQVMMNQKSLVADIRLDPPHLGGMKIKIDMSGEAASVNFVVQSQQAREALEQATPRLRELLDEQGIELGQSSVEQETNQKGNTDGDGKMAGGQGGSGQDEFDEELPDAQTVNVVNGSVNGIDYFA